MAKPKREPKTSAYLEDVDFFFEVFQKLGNDRAAWQRFLKDLLTESEVRMIKRRFHIARLLAEGRSIREVARLAQVGTDTVNRVSKVLRSGRGALRHVVESFAKSAAKREAKAPGIRHWIFGDVQE